jgi:hypothetical protein
MLADEEAFMSSITGIKNKSPRTYGQSRGSGQSSSPTMIFGADNGTETDTPVPAGDPNPVVVATTETITPSQNVVAQVTGALLFRTGVGGGAGAVNIGLYVSEDGGTFILVDGAQQTTTPNQFVNITRALPISLTGGHSYAFQLTTNIGGALTDSVVQAGSPGGTNTKPGGQISVVVE